MFCGGVLKWLSLVCSTIFSVKIRAMRRDRGKKLCWVLVNDYIHLQRSYIYQVIFALLLMCVQLLTLMAGTLPFNTLLNCHHTI